MLILRGNSGYKDHSSNFNQIVYAGLLNLSDNFGVQTGIDIKDYVK